MLVAFIGCNSADQPDSVNSPQAGDAAVPAQTAVGILLDLKRVSSDGLPALAPPLGAALDDGRVRVAGPETWRLQPRSQDYLALFLADPHDKFPRILVTREASDPESFDTLTEENVDAYAQQLAAQLDEEKRQVEEIRPMVIGGRPCVRYVIFGKTKLHKVETQHLETVVNGRVYRVDLTAYRQTTEAEPPIKKYRDHAYAVMAGLDFLESAANTNNQSATPE